MKKWKNDLETREMRPVTWETLMVAGAGAVGEEKWSPFNFSLTSCGSATAGVINFNGAREKKKERREKVKTRFYKPLSPSAAFQKNTCLPSMAPSLSDTHIHTYTHTQGGKQKDSCFSDGTCLEAFHGEMWPAVRKTKERSSLGYSVRF